MDAKSAFDIVVHPNLMRKLYNSGVTGHEWLVIDSLYRDSLTSVRWQGQISPTFVNQQGVRQGGVLGADLFKIYNNGTLCRIDDSGKGATIVQIGLPAPMCADDMAMLSNTSCGLQSLIHMEWMVTSIKRLKVLLWKWTWRLSGKWVVTVRLERYAGSHEYYPYGDTTYINKPRNEQCRKQYSDSQTNDL